MSSIAKTSAATVLAIASSYSTGFLLDMWLRVVVGQLSASSALMPSITWTSVSIFGLALASAFVKKGLIVALPFFANGVLAMGASIIHPRNLLIGVGLIGLGVVIVKSKSTAQVTSSGARDRGLTFSVGDYTLGQEITDAHVLREVSATDFAAFAVRYLGQKIYNAPAVLFIEQRWELTLGVVNGRIYKIAPYLLRETESDASAIAAAAMNFCRAHLGEPDERRTGWCFWTTADGNVILQTGQVQEGYAIDIFLTSRNVSAFKRLP